MQKLFVLFCIVSFLSACNNNLKDESKIKEVQAINLEGIYKEFPIDLKLMSYAYGQVIRNKANQETRGAVIENQFIESYLFGKQSDMDLNIANQKMSQSKQKIERDPSFMGEMSQNLGVFMGLSDSKNSFVQNLDLVVFAEGFKDAGLFKNKLNLQVDSLIYTQQNAFHDFVGKRFLQENKKQTGVLSTASGLQYKIIKKGTGATPKANSDVEVHYTGKLISGVVFDSSVERGAPITFNLQGVIPGWTEGLQLMAVGSKYMLYSPQEIGYGAQAAGTIPANSTLVFEVELLSIK